MNKETGEVKIAVKDTQGEEVNQDEKSPAEENHKEKEKPLEKMTKPDLLKKIKEIEEKSKKNYDIYLRSQAEIENIKKRNNKEKEDWIRYSNETLIKQILPVMDNLEKALSHCDNENSLDALKEGVELTLKGLKNTLAKSGLEEVKTEGKSFDPSFHQAVSELEDKNVKPGTILQELQKGYTFNQRLIRPSIVVVSKGTPDNLTNYDMSHKRECEKL